MLPTKVLFRVRDRLLTQGHRVLRWLAGYNLAVILAVLAYQAPWELVLARGYRASKPECSAPGVIGVFSLLGLSYQQRSGLIVADILLWALLRLQMQLAASPAFTRVAALVKDWYRVTEEDKLRSEDRFTSQQGARAWDLWVTRRQREARLARLREAVSSESGAFGVDASLLDFGPGAESRAYFRPSRKRHQEVSRSPAPKAGPGAAAATPPRIPVPGAGALPRPVLEVSDTILVPAAGDGGGVNTGKTPASVLSPGTTSLPFQRTRLTALWRRLERFVSSGNYNESYACFASFGLLFLIDFSLLSLTFVIGSFG